ncbi:hypothetical protein, partial [Accumulibacter sp.]
PKRLGRADRRRRLPVAAPPYPILAAPGPFDFGTMWSGSMRSKVSDVRFISHGISPTGIFSNDRFGTTVWNRDNLTTQSHWR